MTESVPEVLLRITGLKKYFEQTSGVILRSHQSIKAVDGVSLEINRGETLGLVGESGCGKTTLGRTILRLLDPTDGTIEFNGRDISGVSGRELRDLRKDIQVIFQDPRSSLDPRMPVGDIIAEPLKNYDIGTKDDRSERVDTLLTDVGLKPEHSSRYRHELSGGQQQRVAIARALAVEPDFIVCDEPTSALDVSVQAKILNRLRKLKEEYGLTYLFISHDLDTVGYISDRIAVMYAGEIVETASKERIFNEPLHPYTQALLSANPKPNPELESDRMILDGEVPDPADFPSGCRFHPRCPYATPECADVTPELTDKIETEHEVACINAREIHNEPPQLNEH